MRVSSKRGVKAESGSYSLSPLNLVANEIHRGDGPARSRRSNRPLDRGAENDGRPHLKCHDFHAAPGGQVRI